MQEMGLLAAAGAMLQALSQIQGRLWNNSTHASRKKQLPSIINTWKVASNIALLLLFWAAMFLLYKRLALQKKKSVKNGTRNEFSLICEKFEKMFPDMQEMIVQKWEELGWKFLCTLTTQFIKFVFLLLKVTVQIMGPSRWQQSQALPTASAVMLHASILGSLRLFKFQC